MLLEFILAPIFWIIQNLLSLLPVFELPTSFTGSTSAFFTLIAGASYFLPLDTLSIIFSLALGYYFLKFSISAFNWLIAKIPTIN